MGQSFKIINQRKQQYLEPLHLPSSDRFPSLIRNPLTCKLVTWLVCSSKNSAYEYAKRKGFYSDKHMGAWYGDEVDIIGDYDEEDFCHLVRSEYQDIAVEAIAMLLENDEDLLQEFLEQAKSDIRYFHLLAKVGLLEHCPKPILYQLKERFGENWKVRHYTGKII